MKIAHKSKRAATPHPQVADLIAKISDTPNELLGTALSQIETWAWPRSDLNAWIKVLNRFDEILEDCIRDYEIDKIQTRPFDNDIKYLVSGILKFERLLLENTTNRKMFASYDRIKSLMSTSDLDILLLALNLLLRPAQQYSAQPHVSQALSISTQQLLCLAKRWPHARDNNLSLVDLASEQGVEQVNGLPPEAREVNFTFYKKQKTNKSSGAGSNSADPKIAPPPTSAAPPQTPARKTSSGPATSAAPLLPSGSGAVPVHIDHQTIESQSAMDVLKEAVNKYEIPEDEEKYELLCRIRAAGVLVPSPDALDARQKYLTVRLLAISIFCHTHGETQAQSSLFLYEPDLVAHIAELLQSDKGVPISVQSAAIAALDALARYRNKIQEVLAAINAGVNHGIIMTLLRRTVASVSDPLSSMPQSYVEGVLSFVTYLASHTTGGNMLVGAGLVPLLIQLLDNRLPNRLAIVSKTVQLTDNVLYGFPNAFQLFVNNRGVDTLVGRIQSEVTIDISESSSEPTNEYSPYGQLSVSRAAVLKHTLRSMHRMMQSSGTAEGLRGLIDSSLLKSIHQILENRTLFGPSIVSLAINIMATFIHNEPTCLTVIQEAKLPEVFYKSLDAGIEPSIEVIQAIPNALGALCLNQTGQDQLAARPTVIPGLLSIFTSEKHLKVLQDKENAVLVGTAVDELVRHHPSLKAPVFEAIKSSLSKIEDMGSEFEVPAKLKPWYTLVPDSNQEKPNYEEHSEDVVMSDSLADGSGSADGAATGHGGEEQGPRAHDNIVVSFIDVFGRFLEGLFQHSVHCRDFISKVDGLTRLGRITALPCLPYEFANSVASDSLVQVIRTLAEVATNETLAFLSGIVKESLTETKDFWFKVGGDSKLMPLLDLVSTDEEQANHEFHKLTVLHTRITLLSEVYATAGFGHPRTSVALLQTLMSNGGAENIPDLGALHRTCVWENIVFKVDPGSQGVSTESSILSELLPPADDAIDGPTGGPTAPSTATTSQPSLTANGNTNVEAGLSPTPTPNTTEDAPPQASKDETPRQRNGKALRHLVTQIPISLGPFFQAIVKLFNARRQLERTQRQQFLHSGSVIADVLVQHLSQKDISDVLSSHAYHTVMLGHAAILLVEERPNQSYLNTVLVFAFYRAGGLDAVLDICRRFISSLERLVGINADNRSESDKQELVHSYGGLKVALRLLEPLVTAKSLLEATQTQLVATTDKPETDSAYFEARNFLVKLRTAILPVVRTMWESSWLPQVPVGVSRSIASVVLELAKGEGEDAATGDAAPVLPPTALPGPDETRIRQLTDMGFPRSAAERALIRMHNNVAAAAELLLAQPFALHPDPEPAQAAHAEDAEMANADEHEGGDNVSTNGAGEASTTEQHVPSSDPLAVNAPEPASGKSAEEWRQELAKAREPLRNNMGKLALRLVDEQPSLIFDVQNAFLGASGDYQTQSIRQLVSDIKEFQTTAYDVHEQPMALRFRLLALVMNNSSRPLELLGNDDKHLMDVLLALLLSNPIALDSEHPVLPKWLATHMLVAESLLTAGEDIRSITLPQSENDEIQKEELMTGPTHPEARSFMFDLCLRLLAVPQLPRDEYLSSLRLLVFLTRDHSTASEFIARGGLPLLFSHHKTSSADGAKSYISLIVRHIVEEPRVLQHTMQREIKRLLAHSKANFPDPSHYVRTCSAAALRDPAAFIQATEAVCQLHRPFGVGQHISLKKTEMSASTSAPKDQAEMPVDSPSPSAAAASGALDEVVYCLISELMQTVKPAETFNAVGPGESAPTSESTPGVTSSPAPAADASTSKADHDVSYPCFLMQCLTELLFSYDACKLAFLSYSPRKRSHPSSKEHPNKHRTAALNFFLYDLISFGSIHPPTDADARKRVTLCNWAMSVLVALCVNGSSSNDLKDVSDDLVSVRKFVVDAISRAIKEVIPSDTIDARYGRLLALAELSHRLLTVRFNTSTRKVPEDSPTHIAKVMLEKNFVSHLTNALGEIDLNYPNVRGLVTALLKPEQHLTKIAIKMSRSSDKKEISEDQAHSESSMSDDDEDGEDEEDEDEAMDADEGREETPDLYRNSSLGMFGGEMEDVNLAQDEEAYEEDDGDEDDVEMDFGEETGSDNSSQTDEEDDLDAEDSESAWGENEDEEEDDLVHNEEDDGMGGDDDDDEDEDEAADDEITWQDDGNDAIDDADEEEMIGDMPPLHDLEEVAGDSEADDFVDELDVLHAPDEGADPEGLGFSVVGTNLMGAGHAAFAPGLTFFSRDPNGRTADITADVFGRSRNVPVPPPEATTHPLLLDESHGNGHANSGLPRGSRRSQRGSSLGNEHHPSLFQTIETLLGGHGLHAFRQIMATAPEGLTDVLSMQFLGVSTQNGRPNVHTHLHIGRNPRSRDNRPENRGFDPLHTGQRWAEETKMLYRTSESERLAKLADHVVLALLPAAIEEIKAARNLEEEETKRREAEAKAQADAIAEEKEGQQRKAAEAAKAEAEAEAEAATQAPVEDQHTVEADPATASAEAGVEDQDAEMRDVSDLPESSERTDDTAEAEISGAGPSNATERITVMIHGSPVDITDLGIDPTFLEALPDDMREEVLNQHVRDQRAARVERPADSQLDAEFLDALPPELRAEIIQQETLEQNRRRATAPGAPPTGIPADIDPASFIASLDPQLRQVVLMDQDDGFIQTLPSHMIAEASVYRDALNAHREREHEQHSSAARAPPAQPKKPNAARESIQLLDKGQITVLVRLLFFPEVLRKNLLFKVLVNVCENGKTRAELLNILINILQDGTGDLAAIDKSFSQMSVRPARTPGQTPKAAGKQKAATDYFGPLALPRSEAVPELIAQRCLDALTYIVNNNETSSLFFLSEHEIPAGLRRSASKKGKGKEKQASSTHYPVVLLLGLLDRPTLMRTPSILESVVGLLATVTRPLATLKETKESPAGSVDAAAAATTSASEPVTTESDPPTNPTPVATEEGAGTSTQPAQTGPENDETKAKQDDEARPLLTDPPQIPQHALQLIVNILTMGECSARTFQQCLALIQHLSYMADAREVIAQELRSRAQELGQNIQADLDVLAKALPEAQGDVLSGSIPSKFSSPSSDQAKLLRVLKTIDYMYSPKSSSGTEQAQGDREKVQSIYESFRFTPLWKRLGDCLAIIEQRPEVEQVATVLLPLIEALMVVCKYVVLDTKSSISRALRTVSSPKTPTTPRESMEDLFVTFTDTHRKVLNLMVRNNPSLMSGSFSLLVHNPRVLDFDNKRNYFTQQLHRRPHSREQHSTLQLNVRRARVFEDSFQYLQRKTGDQIKYGKLSIRFYDEEGVDAGGLTREWFQILARQMFNPDYALFQPCVADKLTYQPNRASWVNPEHLSFFKFVGRIIGKAIYDGRLLDAYFARSFYRQLLGKPVDYRDVEWVDPEYYNSLCWILENDPTGLDLTFDVEADEFGVTKIVPLKENGTQIHVTNENKKEFVQLSAQYRLYTSIKDQIDAILAGFYDIIPKDLISIFNEQEVELLISGTPDIDVDEWRAATEYHGYTSSDPTIVWWWRALKSFNREERAKVLSFATGTARVPLGGFGDLQGVQGVQKFSIHKAYGEQDRLPQAHTCFNQIDLPEFSSYEMLRQQLLLAINEGGEGFGFA